MNHRETTRKTIPDSDLPTTAVRAATEILWRSVNEPEVRAGILLHSSSSSLTLVTEHESSPSHGALIVPLADGVHFLRRRPAVVHLVDRISDSLVLVEAEYAAIDCPD